MSDPRALHDAIRRVNDLEDVARAIAVAAKLMGEKLHDLERELVEMLNDGGEAR